MKKWIAEDHKYCQFRAIIRYGNSQKEQLNHVNFQNNLKHLI